MAYNPNPIKEATKSSAFFNIDAENAVLAAVLMKPDECVEQFQSLSPSDFYDAQNQRIATAVLMLAKEGKNIADGANVIDALNRLYGNDDDLNRAVHNMQTAPFMAHYSLKEHIEIVRSAAFRREIYEVLNNARKELSDATSDVSAIHDSVRQKLRDITPTSGHVWQSMSDVIASTFSMLERKAKGEEPSMMCGIKLFDDLTTGLHKGELTVVGARPAVGKSAFGEHLALETAKRGYKVGIVSREMTDEQYGLRVIARDTGVDNVKLRTGNLDDSDWSKISESLMTSAGVNISFMFTTRTVEDLRMEVQKKVDSNELDLLIVDYMQLLQSKQKFEQDWIRIGYVSKALKDMTTDFKIAIVALAQVGRSAGGTMPTLAELRGSGDIEQDADNVVFLHKPTSDDDKYVDPDDRGIFRSLLNSGMQYMVLNVAKNRQGRTGCVPVVFNPARMQFTGIAR